MKIYILCEDQAKMGFMDKVFHGEHGLSIFVDSDVKILFDLGATDVFLRNAQLLDVDVHIADYIVVSHGHWDHTNGLKYFKPGEKSIRLVAHPEIFTDRYNVQEKYNGVSLRFKRSMHNFDVMFTRNHYFMTKDIVFLGEVPRMNDFESISTSFHRLKNGEKHPDFITDDSAIAVNTPKGLLIIAGCSHAGICNIIEYAKKVTNVNRVHMVMGGFHLLGDARQLEKTIDYLRKNHVDLLYPMHCTGLSAVCELSRNFYVKKWCAGDCLDF